MSGHWISSDSLHFRRGPDGLLIIPPPPIIMNFPYLNNSQVEELNEFGIIELTDELMAIINQWGSDDDSESNLD